MGPREPTAVTLVSGISLNDLLWVANTRHGPAGHWHARVRADAPEHDHLVDGATARAYLADHGVTVPPGPPDAASLARLRLVREAVHRLLVPGLEPWTAEARTLVDEARFRVDVDGRIAADGSGWPAFVVSLVPALVALVGQRGRLGQCGNPRCRLTFLDDTRNHGRRWCDPGGCGNRWRVGRARGRVSLSSTLRGRESPPAAGPEVQPPR
jgi:predicted RNA-binding Zn ribbon-like protein